MQHGDAVGDLRHHAEVVGDEQHAGAASRLQLVRSASGSRACVVTSSAVVGSSAISSTGSQHQRHRDHDALALPARELVRIRGVDARRVGQVHAAPACDASACALGRPTCGCAAQHLVDLRTAGHHRVERGHRLLEDHAHARAAQVAQRALGSPCSRSSPLRRIRPDRPAWLGQQPHDGDGDNRLARARFAHQADHLAGTSSATFSTRHGVRSAPVAAEQTSRSIRKTGLSQRRPAHACLSRLGDPACRAARRRACSPPARRPRGTRRGTARCAGTAETAGGPLP